MNPVLQQRVPTAETAVGAGVAATVRKDRRSQLQRAIEEAA
jgi:hypothetical protein